MELQDRLSASHEDIALPEVAPSAEIIPVCMKDRKRFSQMCTVTDLVRASSYPTHIAYHEAVLGSQMIRAATAPAENN
jgi:hypothetical protein